ncbi:endonuclease, partial [Escherichia coli]|nr:endonuclease [Escherichia coli]
MTESKMKKYIPVVLFVFSCQVFSADIRKRKLT